MTSFVFFFDVDGSTNDGPSLPNIRGTGIPAGSIQFVGNLLNVQNEAEIQDIGSVFTTVSNIAAARSSFGIGTLTYSEGTSTIRFQIDKLVSNSIFGDRFIYMSLTRLR